MIPPRELAAIRTDMATHADVLAECLSTAGIETEGDYRTSLMLDAMNFLLCIAAADGEITPRERKQIAALFDYDFTEEEWKAYMDERGISDKRFLSTVPYSYHLLLTAEKKHPFGSHPTRLYTDLMNSMSHHMLTAGIGEESCERRVRDRYLLMLTETACEQYGLAWEDTILPSRSVEDAKETKNIIKDSPDIQATSKGIQEMSDSLQELAGIIDMGQDACSVRELLLNALRDFLCRLAGADGVIHAWEAVLLNRLLPGFRENSFSMQWRVREMRRSGLFATRQPTILERLAALDKRFYSVLTAQGTGLSGSVLLTVFSELGRAYLAAKGYITDAEAERFLNTVTRMERYYYENHFPELEYTSCASQPIETRPAPQQQKQRVNTGDLDSLMAELDALTGLESVKAEVRSLVYLQEMQRQRLREGLPSLTLSNHLVFSGNPGTGKTTVARLLASIYYRLGLLKEDKLTEVDRSGLVSGYVGQTALKVQEAIQKACGGILFIDEAYTLAPQSGNGPDFGQEAIDTLLKAMEDKRDELIVIVAGYTKPMERFIASNPGLKSRFNKYLHFSDYNAEELADIFRRFCSKNAYTLSPEAESVAAARLRELYEHRGENFANAREVRNLFERVISRQAERLFHTPGANKAALTRIEAADFA